MPERPSPADRVARRLVRADNGCLEFTGSRDRRGYGRVNVKRIPELAHRIAWEAANGPIHDGLCVLHRCDNPPCCDVAHLFLGTKADNNADMAAKGRHWCSRKTHCPHGHEYTPENTRVYDGKRRCYICLRKRQLAQKR